MVCCITLWYVYLLHVLIINDKYILITSITHGTLLYNHILLGD